MSQTEVWDIMQLLK